MSDFSNIEQEGVMGNTSQEGNAQNNESSNVNGVNDKLIEYIKDPDILIGKIDSTLKQLQSAKKAINEETTNKEDNQEMRDNRLKAYDNLIGQLDKIKKDVQDINDNRIISLGDIKKIVNEYNTVESNIEQLDNKGQEQGASEDLQQVQSTPGDSQQAQDLALNVEDIVESNMQTNGRSSEMRYAEPTASPVFEYDDEASYQKVRELEAMYNDVERDIIHKNTFYNTSKLNDGLKGEMEKVRNRDRQDEKRIRFDNNLKVYEFGNSPATSEGGGTEIISHGAGQGVAPETPVESAGAGNAEKTQETTEPIQETVADLSKRESELENNNPVEETDSNIAANEDVIQENMSGSSKLGENNDSRSLLTDIIKKETFKNNYIELLKTNYSIDRTLKEYKRYLSYMEKSFSQLKNSSAMSNLKEQVENLVGISKEIDARLTYLALAHDFFTKEYIKGDSISDVKKWYKECERNILDFNKKREFILDELQDIKTKIKESYFLLKYRVINVETIENEIKDFVELGINIRKQHLIRKLEKNDKEFPIELLDEDVEYAMNVNKTVFEHKKDNDLNAINKALTEYITIYKVESKDINDTIKSIEEFEESPKSDKKIFSELIGDGSDAYYHVNTTYNDYMSELVKGLNSEGNHKRYSIEYVSKPKTKTFERKNENRQNENRQNVKVTKIEELMNKKYNISSPDSPVNNSPIMKSNEYEESTRSQKGKYPANHSPSLHG